MTAENVRIVHKSEIGDTKRGICKCHNPASPRCADLPPVSALKPTIADRPDPTFVCEYMAICARNRHRPAVLSTFVEADLCIAARGILDLAVFGAGLSRRNLFPL